MDHVSARTSSTPRDPVLAPATTIDVLARHAPREHATLALHIACVSKRFRDRRVIDDVSFDVLPGQSVAIAGINGAGKTTLLRCLLDFMRADGGRIEIFGVDSRQARARRALAYLPERFMPSPHLSGRETLRLLGGLHGLHHADHSIAQVLDRLEFPREALTRPVRQYSKGMTQKLGLAALLLADAPLLVLDEPMSGLDPLARRLVTAVLALERERGRTLIFTSHAPRDIENLCDRLAVLHGGRLRHFGTPSELCQCTGTDDLESAFIRTLH
ncbi:MAG: ABC transporter ATP-binding protein [Burkholderiaceae bacterium]